jgi:DNA-binding Lrp family transcriptional regulator
MARKKLDAPSSVIEKTYYSSRSHTQASKMLSEKYGLTPRAWRYRIRKMEEQGVLNPESLKVHKGRDLLKIRHQRATIERKKEKIIGEVMLTVHFKIKYEQIGSRGFHPFHLEGFYTRKVPRDFTNATVMDMMNWVQGKLSEFGALTEYLHINNQEYEEGVEVEEVNKSRKHDEQFEYDFEHKRK